MRARWGAAVGVAAALAAAGARATGESPCGLDEAVRSLTSSRSCITCHDGTAASPISLGRNSHPVGIDYATAANGSPGRYASISQLPPAVVLVGGKVECTSCHDGASRRRFKLAGGKDLCLGCHLL
jgi:predicted CXXCH cytochrome family protein